jgi:phosphatidylserine/phosphatidylglycerophosphate/cardiolipin synthase-like enzyme
VDLADWFLTAAERDNPATRLDSRHPDGAAWTTGNEVRALIHGKRYFAELLSRVRAMDGGDLLLFTDWRGDPDQWLGDAGPAVSTAFCEAARRGVHVRGLVWRSHLDRFRFSGQENRHLGEEIDAAGGQCLLDMRVRPGGSHHMKLVVLRHASKPERDAAFVGGIDLCHSRRDDAAHQGDPQRQPMAAVYGHRPPWHDAQLMIRGPAVGDVETVFRERWEDPAPLTRNPLARLHDLLQHVDADARRLPPQRPDPPRCGHHAVQVLRTYPYRRRGYRFAPQGERSIARAYLKVLSRARSLIYLEDQYLWSTMVAGVLAQALAANPALHLIAVLPAFPDQDGRLALPPNLLGRVAALEALRAAGGDRVAVYSLENAAGVPIYVHAKVCVIDDTWAVVGSDNFNRRSWTHDSELSCAVIDEAGRPGHRGPPLAAPVNGVAMGEMNGVPLTGAPAGSGADGAMPTWAGPFPRALRVALAREHLGAAPDDADDPRVDAFAAFRRAAQALDAWHADGRCGPRPPGQLRGYPTPQLSSWTRAWASVPYRLIYDPDGRPLSWRGAGKF